MRRYTALLLLFILLSGGIPVAVSTAQVPVGACPANGPLVISQNLVLTNLTCTHVGSITLSTGAALSLINSALTVDANGSSATLALGTSATLNLSHSTLNFVNGHGSLTEGQSAAVRFLDSNLFGGSVSQATLSSLVANQSSILEPEGFSASGLSTFFLSGSRFIIERPRLLPILNNVTSVPVTIEGGEFEMLSSSMTFDEVLNVTVASTYTYILQSNIQTFDVGTFKLGNSTNLGALTVISSSQLQTGGYASMRLALGGTNSLSVQKSSIQSQGPAIVSYNSRYTQVMDSTFNGATSKVVLFGYQFNATNSVWVASNTHPLFTFGTSVVVGNLYNDTFTNCAIPPKATCFAVNGNGGLSVYGWLTVHVADKTTTKPLTGARVQVVDTITGLVDYLAITDTNGNATIPVLAARAGSSLNGIGALSVLNRGSYLVTASYNGVSSPQSFFFTNNTASVGLGIIQNPGNLTSQAISKGASSLGLSYNVLSQSFPVSPSAFYVLGPYVGTEYVPSVTIASNASPLNFAVNAGTSQMTFNTVGQQGSVDSFVVYYPKNLTVSPISATVDGVPVSTTVGSNSTYYFTSFYLPSGIHSVVMSFVPPNGSFTGPITYPYVYPSATLIAVVLLISGAGLFVVFVFVRRRESWS